MGATVRGHGKLSAEGVRDLQPIVLEFAARMAGVTYHLRAAAYCARMVDESAGAFASRAAGYGLQGAYSQMGEGMALVHGAAGYELAARALGGNSKIAEKAARWGLDLPTNAEVYAEAVRLGIIPEDYETNPTYAGMVLR